MITPDVIGKQQFKEFETIIDGALKETASYPVEIGLRGSKNIIGEKLGEITHGDMTGSPLLDMIVTEYGNRGWLVQYSSRRFLSYESLLIMPKQR